MPGLRVSGHTRNLEIMEHKNECPYLINSTNDCTCYQQEPVSILVEAEQIINGQRRDDYGDVSTSFRTIGELWSPILGVEVTPHQVALCMIQLKISRYMNGKQRDSLVDIAGYAGCLEKLDNA